MPNLNLPAGRLAACMDLVRSALETDPTLGFVGARVVSYRDGYEESEKAKPAPDDSEGVFIRVSFEPSGMRWENEHQHRIDFAIGLTLFTPGPDERDMLNLIEAVLVAIFPQQNPGRSARREAMNVIPGLSYIKMGQSLADVSLTGQSAHGLRAKVRLICSLTLNS